MKSMSLTAVFLISLALVTAGCEQEQQASKSDPTPDFSAEKNISVHFVSPEDGARVTSPFKVEMAAEGVEVVPAGTMREGTGHMHILVDAPFVRPGNVIPSDDQHLHYGDGSTTAMLDLPPGEHVLRLQLADGAHKAFVGGEYRDVIVVNVEGEAAPAVSEETQAPADSDDEQPADTEAGDDSGEAAESGDETESGDGG